MRRLLNLRRHGRKRDETRPPQGMPYRAESFPLWGGTATVMVTRPDRLHDARRSVDQVIADIEAACCPRRGDSELNKVNAAAGQCLPVGATFHAVLWTALHAADVTGGLVDPTADSPHWNWRSIRVDEPEGTVMVPAGARLDFGSVAQSFAADRAAELAAGRTACGVLVDIGGSVAAAGRVPLNGWPVPVDDGIQPPGRPFTLRKHGGVATSSIVARPTPLASTRAAPHIVDPRSGRPVHGPWRTVSVAAGNCVDADTASIAAIVRGHDAPDWLTSLGLPARLVHVDGWAITVAGWPADPDEPAAEADA